MSTDTRVRQPGDIVRVTSPPWYGSDLAGFIGCVYARQIRDGRAEYRIGDGDVDDGQSGVDWTWSAWVGAAHLEAAPGVAVTRLAAVRADPAQTRSLFPDASDQTTEGPNR